MKLFSICPGCNKRKLLIRKRKYITVHAGTITSQKETCGKCKNNVIIMLGEEIKK